MTLKLTFALVAVGGAALITSGCGNDVPAGAVAKVGDSTIEKSEFDKWLAHGRPRAPPRAAPPRRRTRTTTSRSAPRRS